MNVVNELSNELNENQGSISHRDPRIRSNKNKPIISKADVVKKNNIEKVANMREELEIQLQKDRSSPVRVMILINWSCGGLYLVPMIPVR